MYKIKIERNTAGDSRVAKSVPSQEDFDHANYSHRNDVYALMRRFCDLLTDNSIKHDWTKTKEPYRSMFYHDLCQTVMSQMDFFDGEWSKLHYYELERHHLKRHCPEDVNLLDVVEMVCDCVAAGMARSGEVYDLDIDEKILTKALNNTVKLLKDQIEVVDRPGEVPPKKSDDPNECKWLCGSCGYPLWDDEYYCAHCGKKVKWSNLEANND